MKQIKQIKVIQETDPTIFQTAVNEFLQGDTNILEIAYPEGKGLCALIQYEIRVDEEKNTQEDKYQSDYCVDLTDPAHGDQAHTLTITLKVNPNEDRYCCECDNYNWGKNCPYRKGHVDRMDPACDMFNVIIKMG